MRFDANADDFYTEGELVWLDVDSIVRERSHGARSLDTFLHRYTEPATTGPIVVTYTRAQVEELLDGVEPYDWHDFLRTIRVSSTSIRPATNWSAPAGGIVYTSKPNEFITARQATTTSLGWYAYGANLSTEGVVRDVRDDSAAWQAGLVPGMSVLAVNGQQFSPDVLEYAVKHAQHTCAPMSLIVKQTGWYQTLSLDYHDGVRYPHLERIPGIPDMLAAIVAPHAQ